MALVVAWTSAARFDVASVARESKRQELHRSSFDGHAQVRSERFEPVVSCADTRRFAPEPSLAGGGFELLLIAGRRLEHAVALGDVIPDCFELSGRLESAAARAPPGA